MKARLLLILIMLFVIITSCTSYFYQVYKVTPGKGISTNDNSLVFEDENCKVIYNLWSENGNIGFDIYNKCDVDLYLNMSECFFILNGVANDYYRDRIFTNEETTSISAFSTYFGLGATSSNKVSIAYKEKEAVTIPAKTSKHISEYQINGNVYRNCDLYLTPSKKEIKTVTFSEENSPFVFSNRLTLYKVDETYKPIDIIHDFYVSEITNYPEDEITEHKKEEFCGEKSAFTTTSLKEASANKFFVKYSDISPSTSFEH